LAREFVHAGWSLKTLHRLMMTSAVYRQDSVRTDAKICRAADEENDLLWRMRGRRMDAEQLRDSILFVSGELDSEMGGPAVAEEKSARRSIYVLNKRNKRTTMMNAFDTPDLHNSCAARDVTTTPIQALALLNGNWTIARAERFAERVLSDEDAGVEQRIGAAYRLALGRLPADQDRGEVRALLAAAGPQGQARRSAWVDICHVLLNTNEFIYIH
jgi:hypothetical protein